MNKAEILGLALRVEALEGADREVDAQVAAALRVGTLHFWAWNFHAWQGRSDGRVYLEEGGPSFAAPHYTSSIDAALTLVERGDEWQLSTIYNIARAEVGINRDHQTSWPGRGEHDGCNPVLAILAVALRAIASTMEDDRG